MRPLNSLRPPVLSSPLTNYSEFPVEQVTEKALPTGSVCAFKGVCGTCTVIDSRGQLLLVLLFLLFWGGGGGGCGLV